MAILLSIGHQTQLFDTLSEPPPATSTQIADAAGLNERYVREWLGGVVAARIVDYDPAAQTYSLPQHRAAVLTRAAGPDNLARVAQFIPLLAEVEQKVIGCFQPAADCPTAISAFPHADGRGERARCSTRLLSTASCRWPRVCRSG